MKCPNGCGEMESNCVYIEVGDYGTDVTVWMCQKCYYAEASTS